MAWCEANAVDYVFGLARNARLLAEIEDPLAEAEAEHGATGQPARRFDDFTYATLDSWSRERRVVGKAEHLAKGANPRFIVTSLPKSEIDARTLYEDIYCARGDMENRMYGRLPPCKQVSSSFRHAWSAAAMYPASLGYTPAGLDEFRELAPDYQGELEALRFSRALPTPVRPACHRVKEHPRSLWRSRQSRFTQASIRPPRDRLRRGSALPRPSGRAYWPPPLPPR